MPKTTPVTKATRIACKLFIAALIERKEKTGTSRYRLKGPSEKRPKQLQAVQKKLDIVSEAASQLDIPRKVNDLIAEIDKVAGSDPFFRMDMIEFANNVLSVLPGEEVDGPAEIMARIKKIRVSGQITDSDVEELISLARALIDRWAELIEAEQNDYHQVQFQRHDGVLVGEPRNRKYDPRLLELATALENERKTTGKAPIIKYVAASLIEMNETLVHGFAPGDKKTLYPRVYRRLRQAAKYVREYQPPGPVELKTVGDLNEYLRTNAR